MCIRRKIRVPAYYQECRGYIKGPSKKRIPCTLHYCGLTEDDTVDRLRDIVKKSCAGSQRFHPEHYSPVVERNGFVSVSLWQSDFWKYLFTNNKSEVKNRIISKYLRRENDA